MNSIDKDQSQNKLVLKTALQEIPYKLRDDENNEFGLKIQPITWTKLLSKFADKELKGNVEKSFKKFPDF